MATAFRPRKRGISYSEALTAAYASAPETEILLDTLEFRHAEFKDPNTGELIGLRGVNDHTELYAHLESNAVLNAGQEVRFHPIAFKFTRPTETNTSTAPEIQLQIDNAARILVPYLDLARKSRSSITVTWRQYLASDLTTPHILPPLTMTLKNVSANMTQVTATAGFADLTNRRFPAVEYSSLKFPGLTAR
jgi:hypothetical protein